MVVVMDTAAMVPVLIGGKTHSGKTFRIKHYVIRGKLNMRSVRNLTLSLLAAILISGCSDSNTIATVGDRKITDEEFRAYLQFKRIPQQDQARVDRALDEYLQRIALAMAVEESGQLDNALIQAELEEFRNEMLISRHFEGHLRQAVDEQAVENYYTNHVEQYQSRSAHAAHILIRVDNRMSEAERQSKLTAAREAFSRLQAGEDFAELAKEYSEDKVSAEKGGDLGWLREGAVAPEFSEKLFSLETGEITEPFLTPFGFHIVKLTDGPRNITRSLEGVAGDIRYQLRNQVKQAETERLLNAIQVSVK